MPKPGRGATFRASFHVATAAGISGRVFFCGPNSDVRPNDNDKDG